jgi:hypothetical protein
MDGIRANDKKLWVPTGIRTYPIAAKWNTFRILVTRDDNNGMLYQMLQFNRVSTQVSIASQALSIAEQATWWGININFQVDGTGKPVTVYPLDLCLDLE